MDFYKLSMVWLCKLASVNQGEDGRINYFDFEPCYILVEKEDAFREQEEVPEFRSTISGEEYYDGTNKGVYSARDIGKVFVTDKLHIPIKMLNPEEIETMSISADRICELSRIMFYSRLFG